MRVPSPSSLRRQQVGVTIEFLHILWSTIAQTFRNPRRHRPVMFVLVATLAYAALALLLFWSHAPRHHIMFESDTFNHEHQSDSSPHSLHAHTHLLVSGVNECPHRTRAGAEPVEQPSTSPKNHPTSALRPTWVVHPRSRADEDVVVTVVSLFRRPSNDELMYTYQALLQQTFPRWEWIVVDASGERGIASSSPVSPHTQTGPSASPSALLLALQAKDRQRVKIVTLTTTLSEAGMRNEGAKEAVGRYLMFADVGDAAEATYLEKAVWFFETHAQFSLVSAFAQGRDFAWRRGFQQQSPQELIKGCAAPLMAVMRRVAFPGFSEHRAVADYPCELWRHLLALGHWGYTLPEWQLWMQEAPDARDTPAHLEAVRRMHGTELSGTRSRERSGQLADPPEAYVVRNAITVNCNQQRHLLFIVPWLQVGGADDFTRKLARLMLERRWAITVVTTHDGAHPWLKEMMRVTPDVHSLPDFLELADYPRYVSYLIESRRVTAVSLSNSQPGYYMLPYLKTRFPTVVFTDYIHSIVPDWKQGGYARFSAKAAPYLDVSFDSSYQVQRWKRERGANAERQRVLHCGVDVDFFQFSREARAATRRELGIQDDVVVLCVSRLSHEKGAFVLHKAVERLGSVRDGLLLTHRVEYRVIVVGDGPLRESLESLTIDKELGDTLTYVGAKTHDDVKRLLSAADVFVLPSTVEGISVATMEAMAMGLYPVVTDVGAQQELVGDIGHVVDIAGCADDGERAARLAPALRHAIVESARRTERPYLKARAKIVEEFSLENLGSQFEAAIQHAKTQPLEPPAFFWKETLVWGLEAQANEDWAGREWQTCAKGQRWWADAVTSHHAVTFTDYVTLAAADLTQNEEGREAGTGAKLRLAGVDEKGVPIVTVRVVENIYVRLHWAFGAAPSPDARISGDAYVQLHWHADDAAEGAKPLTNGDGGISSVGGRAGWAAFPPGAAALDAHGIPMQLAFCENGRRYKLLLSIYDPARNERVPFRDALGRSVYEPGTNSMYLLAYAHCKLS